MNKQNNWPELIFSEYQDTLETLHQWIQIVGKVRLRTMPWQNHSWHTALYVNAHGFTTNGIPYDGRVFQIDFDFVQHKLFIECTNAPTLSFDLKPMTVVEFYDQLFERLEQIGLNIKIHGSPNEIEPAIPFKENTVNTIYEPKAANALWRAILQVNIVFNQFRSEFIGKCSPVHLFWGAFDLAVTRFSGKSAPLHPGGMPNMPLDVMQEAYSQEVNSAGFWLGSKNFQMAAFYAYIYPGNDTYGKQKVEPKEAFYSAEMGEFFLKYEDLQKSDNPEKTLHDFLQSTYETGVKALNWDRKSLEKS